MPTPTQRRILVAEDNDSARAILCDLCRMFGYEVDAVSHGLAAVEAAKAKAYDAILMDCHMPVLDGFDATRRIRAALEKRVVIIAVTGGGSASECLEAGMDDHLTKPVRPQVLRAALARWVDRSGRQTPPYPRDVTP